jgi:hypothetical protein
MEKPLNRLISRLEQLEAKAVLSGKQFSEWVGTRHGAMLVLRTIAAMRWLALDLAIQAQIMAQVVASECVEAASSLAAELLAPRRITRDY